MRTGVGISLKVRIVNWQVSKFPLFTRIYIHEIIEGAGRRAVPGPAGHPFWPLTRDGQNDAASGVRSVLREEERALARSQAAQRAAPLGLRGHADAGVLRGERPPPPGRLRARPRCPVPPAVTPGGPASVSGTQPTNPKTGAVLVATPAPRQLRCPHVQVRTRPVGDRPPPGGCDRSPRPSSSALHPPKKLARNVAEGKGHPGSSDLICVL